MGIQRCRQESGLDAALVVVVVVVVVVPVVSVVVSVVVAVAVAAGAGPCWLEGGSKSIHTARSFKSKPRSWSRFQPSGCNDIRLCMRLVWCGGGGWDSIICPWT